jgi:tyrosyl-tRNA synthetase
MIGDPSGKSEERNLLSVEQLERNVAGIGQQLQRLLDFDGDNVGFRSAKARPFAERKATNAALLLNNFDWMRSSATSNFCATWASIFPST